MVSLSEEGVGIVVDYTLRISRKARVLSLFSFSLLMDIHLSMSDRHSSILVILLVNCREGNIQLSVIGEKVKLHFVES